MSTDHMDDSAGRRAYEARFEGMFFAPDHPAGEPAWSSLSQAARDVWHKVAEAAMSHARDQVRQDHLAHYAATLWHHTIRIASYSWEGLSEDERKAWEVLVDTLTVTQKAPDKAGEREGLAGWKLMPPQPTDAMIQAARAHGIGVHSFTLAYTAALHFAPQPNATEASRGLIPAGWKLVPAAATEEMITCAGEFICAGLLDDEGVSVEQLWTRFLLSAPTPPLSPDSTGPAPGWARAAVDAYWTHEGQCLSGRLLPETREAMASAVHAAILSTSSALNPSAPIAARGRDDGAREASQQELRQHWEAFCGADQVPDGFIERMEAVGLAQLRKVTRDDLQDCFAAERGIERGGYVWDLTRAGREILAASLPAPAGDVPGEAQAQEGGR